MLEKINNENLTPLSLEEKQARGILGRLSGPVADFINPTRNGRMYDEQLWEKVFESPIIKEYFECGGIMGELDHPVDRLETCSEKIAIVMPEAPKKDKNGQLMAYFDILDTPNGRIAYTLAKYGYKLGISSRGGGDTYTDEYGQERVNEDTYDFQGFDLVLLPAVKNARLKMVESLEKTFKQAINESLQKAKPDEKKVMEETLQNLNIEYTPEKVIDIVSEETNVAANDTGAQIVNDLQESLLKQQKLESQLLELQEKLSVCYAKEAKYEEDIVKYKSAIANLSGQASNVKALQTKLNSLQEQLSSKEEEMKVQLESKDRLLREQTNENKSNRTRLTESLSAKNKELREANKLIESLNKQVEELNISDKQLNEDLAETKKNFNIKTNEYNSKLTRANNLIEQYRNTAKTAVNKYISVKADMLGVSDNEIINKLPSNYSFKDIEVVCESLSNYKVNIGKLPFDLEKINQSKVVIKENKSNIPNINKDDSVDESLLRLAGLK